MVFAPVLSINTVYTRTVVDMCRAEQQHFHSSKQETKGGFRRAIKKKEK